MLEQDYKEYLSKEEVYDLFMYVKEETDDIGDYATNVFLEELRDMAGIISYAEEYEVEYKEEILWNI